jgi:hypothetical protein
MTISAVDETAVSLAVLDPDRFYLVHRDGIRTLALFGTQRLTRFIKRAGYPDVARFEVSAECFDCAGRPIARRSWRVPADAEVVFDSTELLGSAEVEGSAILRFECAVFKERPAAGLPPIKGDANGFVILSRPGSFVTGVHMYHGVDVRPLKFLLKHYLKTFLKRAWFSLSGGGGPWPHDAIGASVVHGSGAGRGFVVMHTDNASPGVGSFIEHRPEKGPLSRSTLPTLPANGTLRIDVPGPGGDWGQVLCALPPPGVGRYLTGERFADGSFCVDHSYFQQPASSRDTKVAKEVWTFSKDLLRDGIIGHSNPWPCFHAPGMETLIAMCKQYQPEHGHVYDVREFDADGKLVYEKIGAIRLSPFGVVVFDLSAELRAKGIERLDGTYLVTHSALNESDLLPNRIHCQGVYRFGGKYWNSVQGDSYLWASPEPAVPEIEALSHAKVRRKQYWSVPVLETEDLETLVVISNLSYSLKYDKSITVAMRYCEGERVIAEAEVTLKPFGSAVLRLSDHFPSLRGVPAGGRKTGCVVLYPKTGLIYCASFMVRDRKTGVFVIEHVLPLPKLAHEMS